MESSRASFTFPDVHGSSLCSLKGRLKTTNKLVMQFDLLLSQVTQFP